MGRGDGYLGENDLLSDGVFTDSAAARAKLARMAAYKEQLGVSLDETATSADPAASAALGARALQVLTGYGIDAFQLTDPLYSARDNVLTAPVPGLRSK